MRITRSSRMRPLSAVFQRTAPTWSSQVSASGGECRRSLYTLSSPPRRPALILSMSGASSGCLVSSISEMRAMIPSSSGRHCPRKRAIQYSPTPLTSTLPTRRTGCPACAGHDDSERAAGPSAPSPHHLHPGLPQHAAQAVLELHEELARVLGRKEGVLRLAVAQMRLPRGHARRLLQEAGVERDR